jgi:tRNA modification GTPase
LTQRLLEEGGIITKAAPGGTINPLGLANIETIAAIATAAGSGGIGIVRISGDRANAIARAIFRPLRPAPRPENHAFRLKPHHLRYGIIVNPADNERLDEVLLAFMPAPNSYTREDVIEIQCHGGPVVLQKILGLVMAQGARLADAGEFTRRAFLNGRIDLTQAEAVADLINARSDSAMKLAARQLSGGLKTQIQGLIAQISDMLADVEAELEFSEDGVNGLVAGTITSAAINERLIVPTRKLVDSYHLGRVLKEGYRLAIVGKPNVGKSSLFNRLIERDKAIVTPFPGTTRDPVEASISIENLPIDFIDTAGMRQSHNPVERIGIRKSQEAMQTVDLSIFVIEAQAPLDEEDHRILQQVNESKMLLVVNKTDLLESSASPVLPRAFTERDPVFVSAKSGAGIDVLKKRIVQSCARQGHGEGEGVICDLRHKVAIEAALGAARHAAESIDEKRPMDMLAMDLKHALVQMQVIIGEGAEADVLDAIFQKFCIGK